MNKYLDISPEVQQALADGKPVVALESTIISHGMPYPKNVETAMLVEKTIRENGAVPATIAIIGGRLKAGLSPEEIEYLGKSGRKVAKVSRRDLAAIVARGADGATTVTTTMIIAHMAGIKVFATGGIGGVHRGAETTMDISADLEELASTPVMVVCAGAKSILDLGLTLEYLETKGVPVIGYGTDELPAFYTRSSGFGVDYRVDTPAQLAAMFKAQQELGYKLEQQDYERQQKAFQTLMSLISSTGYEANEDDLKQSGMSQAQADAIRNEFLRKNGLLDTGGTSSGAWYGGYASKEQTKLDANEKKSSSGKNRRT